MAAPSRTVLPVKWGSVPWRAIVRWAGLLAAVAAAVAVIIVVLGPVTDLIARHDVGAVTGPQRAAALQSARDAARGRLLTLGAGLFAAGALVYTARNFTISRRIVELTLRTVELSEQGQVTDRYTKAIEQLGSDKLDVRIGGIYALERVARDSARDHPAVVEVLAAFVREHSHEQWPHPSWGRARPRPGCARDAPGRTSGRHCPWAPEILATTGSSINLAAANLPPVPISPGGNFS